MTPEDVGGLDRPDFEAFFVVEVDVARDRDNPLFASIRGPYATEEDAKRERDAQQDAWKSVLEEWDDGNPYDFKGWDIVRKYISDFQLDQLEREDVESYRTKMEAVSSMSASLLADEGIGPLAGEDDG